MLRLHACVCVANAHEMQQFMRMWLVHFQFSDTDLESVLLQNQRHLLAIHCIKWNYCFYYCNRLYRAHHTTRRDISWSIKLICISLSSGLTNTQKPKRCASSSVRLFVVILLGYCLKHLSIIIIIIVFTQLHYAKAGVGYTVLIGAFEVR